MIYEDKRMFLIDTEYCMTEYTNTPPPVRFAAFLFCLMTRHPVLFAYTHLFLDFIGANSHFTMEVVC